MPAESRPKIASKKGTTVRNNPLRDAKDSEDTVPLCGQTLCCRNVEAVFGKAVDDNKDGVVLLHG